MNIDRLVGLTVADDDGFELALADAVLAGPPGEDSLVRALPTSSEDRRVRIAAAIGEAEGGQGIAVLRSTALDVDRSADERCASIVALAKRDGVRASDLFAVLLGDRDEAVSRYARRCLGCVGDDRSWDEVLDWLSQKLSIPPRSPNGLRVLTLPDQSVNIAAFVYLGRHAVAANRRRVVVDLIRSQWDRLFSAEQDWARTHWPACEPGYEGIDQAPSSSPEELAEWLRAPLLIPLYRA